MDKRLALPAFGLLGLVLSSATLASEEKVLHVYNWSDYIAEDTVAGVITSYSIHYTKLYEP